MMEALQEVDPLFDTAKLTCDAALDTVEHLRWIDHDGVFEGTRQAMTADQVTGAGAA